MSLLPTQRNRLWRRDTFLISTDPTLVDLRALNAALASDEIPWGSHLPEDELKVMVDHSLCLGVYEAKDATSNDSPSSTNLTMIGFARVITDYVTIAYLTDVYILPSYEGRGLGSWLIECVGEWWRSVPNGRRMALVAAEGEHEAFYARKLTSYRMEDLVDPDKETPKRYRLVSAPGNGKTV